MSVRLLSVPNARLSLARRSLSTSTHLRAHPISRLTVFGAGTMGSGIAHVAVEKGVKVTMFDRSGEALRRAQASISSAFPDAEGAITTSTDMTDALRDAEMVIEAVPERLQLKQDLFREIDRTAPPACIFATNTSSLKIADIAQSCSAERRKRFGGLHFFAPMPASQLVEVARTEEISDEAYETLLTFGKRLRNYALPCTDVPGLVINRLLTPVMLEAIKIIERKQTTPKELDEALACIGWPTALHLADIVGLDVYGDIVHGAAEHAGTGLHPQLLAEPIPLLDEMIRKGHLGRKTGKGFFEYPEK